MQMQRILYATDYSEVSRQALPFAESLARDTGALLVIAHVSQREPHPVGEHTGEDPAPDPSELAELRAVVPSDPGVRHEHRLLHAKPGSVRTVRPADELVRFAQRNQVDAMVLGTHGRSGLNHLLMGSVAESVVRQAPCPVITVKQAEQPRPGGW